MVLNRNYRVFLSVGAPRTVALLNRVTGQMLLFDSLGRGHELAANEFEPVASTFIKWRDVYGCMGVMPVPRVDADTVNYLALVTECKSVGKLGHEIFHISAADFLPLSTDGFQLQGEIISDLKKLFARASFYFSVPAPVAEGDVPVEYDVTASWHAQASRRGPDERFFWNRRMWEELELQGLPAKVWMLPVMRGSVEIRTAYIAQFQAKAAIISRMSCERTGQRFLTRGVDDDGNAANFVETEQILLVGDYSASFVMVRGSVPIFWEQPGLQMGSLKIKLSRGFKATQPAFDSHLNKLTKNYTQVVMVSLLGRKEGEFLLNSTFQKHAQDSVMRDTAPLVQFDVNHHCKGKDAKEKRIQLDPLLLKLRPFLDGSGFFEMGKGKVLRRQSGVVRFNCLDCLDRSNFVQSVVGSVMLDRMLAALRDHRPELTESKCAALQTLFRDEWGVNGDNVSRCVTGTAAISSGNEVSRTVTRAVKNNFYDLSTQIAIDTMLGANIEQIVRKDNAVTDPALRGLYDERMLARQLEFTDQVPINLCIGTWNVNGGKHFRSVAFKGVTMADWLVSPISTQRVDVYAVGFEEMVDLTAQNMVATAQKHRQEWADELTRLLGPEYALVTSVQLVGVCLYVLIRNEHLSAVKEVVADTVKTGAGGRVGNKGGVAVRLRLYNSTVCFVCAHLAAGQSHVAERNSDYAEISRRLTFGKGRNLASHDFIFWCGDFNYRIDMPMEECKLLISQRNWSTLLAFDQLSRERQQEKAFVGFTEGNVAFAPTYKYDLFSDDWDTSEKCRCPAWTDRILFRGDNIELLHYGRNETLKTSDHRPVMALARVTLNRVDEYLRDVVREEVLLDLRRRHATATVSVSPIPPTVALFSSFGPVALVVIEGATALVTFSTSDAAAAALQLSAADAARALHGDGPMSGDPGIVIALVEADAPDFGSLGHSASTLEELEDNDVEFHYGHDDDDDDSGATTSASATTPVAEGSDGVPRALPRLKASKKKNSGAAAVSDAESGNESGSERSHRAERMECAVGRSSAHIDGSGGEIDDDALVPSRGHRSSVSLTAAETTALQESLDVACYSSDDEWTVAAKPLRPALPSSRDPPARPAAAPPLKVVVASTSSIKIAASALKPLKADEPKAPARRSSLARDPKKSIELSGDDGISMPYNVVHQTHANMVDGIMAISKPQRVIPRTHRDLPSENTPASPEHETLSSVDEVPVLASQPFVAIPPPPTRLPATGASTAPVVVTGSVPPSRPAPPTAKATPVKPAPPVSRQPAATAVGALYEPPGVRGTGDSCSDTGEAVVDPLAAAVAAAEATRARILRGAVNVFGGPPPPTLAVAPHTGADSEVAAAGPVAAPRRRVPGVDASASELVAADGPVNGGAIVPAAKQPVRPPAPVKSATTGPTVHVLVVAHDPEDDTSGDESRPASASAATAATAATAALPPCRPPAPKPALPPPPAASTKVALLPPSRPSAPSVRPSPRTSATGPDLLTFSAAELAPDLIAFDAATTDAGVDGFDPVSASPPDADTGTTHEDIATIFKPLSDPPVSVEIANSVLIVAPIGSEAVLGAS